MTRKLTIQNTSKKQYSNVIRLCAAGSGKTFDICRDALSVVNTSAQRKRVLITTFTNNGVNTINEYIAILNRGMPSAAVDVYTWYHLLLAEIIKPYQTFIAGINEIKSFDFDNNCPIYKMSKGRKINLAASGKKERYINRSSNVMSNYASEFAVCLNNEGSGMPVQRLADIYSHVYIDEIQDMAGYDMDLILLLMESGIIVTCVGDYKQATYKTNAGSKNKKTSGKNIGVYCEMVSKSGLASIKNNLTTRRFNKNICDFANMLFPTGDDICSDIEATDYENGVFLIQCAYVDDYFKYYRPTVLKYDVNTPTNGLQSFNFGGCKGMTFDRVLIFPNGVLTDYVMKGKSLAAPEKYYVAVTRPRYSLAIVVEKLPTSTLFEPVTIPVTNGNIQALRFIGS